MKSNRMNAGILTIMVTGIAISLYMFSKKGRQTNRYLTKKSNRVTEELKVRFNEFVDQLNDKVQGILK
jgi:hypothetical protein